MKNNMKTLFTAITALAFNTSVFAYQGPEKLELHGFVSQGYIYSPDNAYAGKSSLDGSFALREIGLNASYEINESTRLTGQLLSRKFIDNSDGELNVDFLLLDHQFVQQEDHLFGVRLGRIKNDVGIYNVSRDVPSARPGLGVPESIYFDSFRDVYLSADGINLYGNVASDLGLFEWSISKGNASSDDQGFEYYAFGGEVPGKIDIGSVSALKLFLEPNAIPGLKVGFSKVLTSLTRDNAQTLADANMTLGMNLFAQGINPLDQAAVGSYIGANLNQFITDSRIDVDANIASIQYAHGDWLWTAEYMKVINDVDIEVLGESNKETAVLEGFYVQTEWYLTYNWSLLFRYDELFLNTNKSKDETAFRNDPTHGYAKGLTLGAKWILDENWTIGAQVSANEGTAWLPVYEGIEDDATHKFWKTYRAAITYQF